MAAFIKAGFSITDSPHGSGGLWIWKGDGSVAFPGDGLNFFKWESIYQLYLHLACAAITLAISYNAGPFSHSDINVIVIFS